MAETEEEYASTSSTDVDIHIFASITSDQATNNMVECPVCFKLFNPELIEDHVEICLQNAALNSEYPTRASVMQTTAVVSSQGTSAVDDQKHHSTAKKPRTEERQVLELETDSDERGASTVQRTTSSRGTEAMRNFFSPRRAASTSASTSASNKRPALTDNDDGQSSVNFKPLADQMRPKSLDDFVGQKHILAPDSMLRRLIEDKQFPSMILWGPPGCGKTSLAHIISACCRASNNYNFVTLSATNCGVTDVKAVVSRAKNDQTFLKRKTVLFIDEIHRFNKLQQDTFLPHVENGTIILIGATTENPSYSLNSPLLSRCRVFALEKLGIDPIMEILKRAAKMLDITVAIIDYTVGLPHLAANEKFITTDALSSLAEMSDGDARIALNGLSMALTVKRRASPPEGPLLITKETIADILQRSHLLYDRKGDEHFNCISALHKSMRGNDANAALYWLGRILESGEDPRYVSRRLIRFASEDVGLADPQALNQAVAAHHACQYIGMPECDVVLAQCVAYLSNAPKSVQVYDAYSRVKACIATHKGPQPGVPIHLRNANTKLDRELGYGKEYIYNPHQTGPVNQVYLPDGLGIKNFWELANHTNTRLE